MVQALPLRPAARTRTRESAPPGNRPANAFRGALAHALTDHSFVFRDAYRQRETLSLAERSAYGLRGRPIVRQLGPQQAATSRRPTVSVPQNIRVENFAVRGGIAARGSTDAAHLRARAVSTVAPARNRSVLRKSTGLQRRRPSSPRHFRCTVQIADVRLHCIVWRGRVFFALRPEKRGTP